MRMSESGMRRDGSVGRVWPLTPSITMRLALEGCDIAGCCLCLKILDSLSCFILNQNVQDCLQAGCLLTYLGSYLFGVRDHSAPPQPHAEATLQGC